MAQHDPFDAFEIHTVAEFGDSAGTYFETVDTPEELKDLRKEARVRFLYTVYGHRTFPADLIPSASRSTPPAMLDLEGYGATAIADFESIEYARDLAHALADGKPVHDFSVAF